MDTGREEMWDLGSGWATGGPEWDPEAGRTSIGMVGSLLASEVRKRPTAMQVEKKKKMANL